MNTPNLELLNPENLINAYANGAFPMADDSGEISFYTTEIRAIFPIKEIHFQKSLLKKIRKGVFDWSVNENFEEVMRACGESRPDSWITDELIASYTNFHKLGFAHSVEVWENEVLVGGLYGVAMGGAFFGESMFNYSNDAAKAAFYFLIQRLRERDFVLLDAQYSNEFTLKLGAVEIPNELYLKYLQKALEKQCKFD